MRQPASCASSHSIAMRSRWLVGSSSRRISGSGASTRTSAARRASPPERFAGSDASLEPELGHHAARRIFVVVLAEPGEHVVERRRDTRRGRAPAADRRSRAVGCTKSRSPVRRRPAPAAICSRVDLPDPLRPTSAIALARRDRQLRALQQRRAAEGQGDVAQLEKGRHQKVPERLNREYASSRDLRSFQDRDPGRCHGFPARRGLFEAPCLAGQPAPVGGSTRGDRTLRTRA